MSGYRIIYADPPWHFATWGEGGNRNVTSKYSTMSIAEICAMPVGDMAADDSALFMWAVQTRLREAFEVIAAWGFEYKTVAYCWVKIKGKQDRLFYSGEDVKIGMGYHTRAGMEMCLLGTRGKNYERLSKGEAQVVFSPLREHSRKPDEIADSIVRLCGDTRRIELFARTKRPGWDAWGNETDKFADYDPAINGARGYEVGCAAMRTRFLAAQALDPTLDAASWYAGQGRGGQ